MSSLSGRPLAAIALASVLMGGAPAHAGRSCEEHVVSVQSTADAFDAALQLETWLDQHQPSVALIARRGQDLSQYNVTFSHVGFVLRNAQGPGWVVLHDLNTCGSADSQLFEQGLAEFFADDLASTEVALVVLQPSVQQALLKALSPSEQFSLHEKHYSAVAYPFATEYQNSNGWAVETLMKALSSSPHITTRQQAQELLQYLKYEPAVLDISPLKRIGARMFKANVSFDDHPGALRWANRITVNTGDALLRFSAQWAVLQSSCAHGNFGPSVCILSPMRGTPE